jgi:hypothetical protein
MRCSQVDDPYLQCTTIWKSLPWRDQLYNVVIDWKAHASRDVPKLATTIANFVFRSLFMTLSPHLDGEEVFGSNMNSVNFSPNANNELHRPDHVIFLILMVLLTCPPNSVNDLHVHGSPCVTQSMFSISS